MSDARTPGGEKTPRRRAAARGAAGPRRHATPTQARALALRILDRVERTHAYADLALSAALGRSDLSARDRAFVTELVYGTLRWRGRLDFLLGQVSDRALADLEPPVRTLLRMGAYQIAFADGVPPSAAVDQSVRCARSHGIERAAGFVNAVLRQLVRRLDAIALPTLEGDPLAHLVHALSIPEWIARRWIADLGAADAAALALASNQVPPLVARANPMRGDGARLLAELQERLPDARTSRHLAGAVELGHQGNPALDPAFLEGRMTLQDTASQLVVEWLAPVPGDRVLDVCAAPGTKTTAIAERIGAAGRVVAIDRSARRLALVGRACRRLGLRNVTTLERDACHGLTDLGSEPGPDEAARRGFDRILVDAPCSGLGTLRRNADARWRVRPDDPAALARVQREILARASELLGPGGTLVYSTCTVWAEENEAVVASVLAGDPTLRIDDRIPKTIRPFIGDDGFLRTWPHRHGTDGFFAARLTRTGAPDE